MKKRSFLYLAIMSMLMPGSLVFAQNAPDVLLHTESRSFQLSETKGQVVYLDFWASWCVPCRKSFPRMNDISKKYAKQGFRVIAVNLDEDVSQAKLFLQKYPAEFTVAFDAKGKLAETFQVKGMPSSYLINRNGEIIRSHIGFREDDPASIEADIRFALASK